jgi:5'-nucleotidase
MNSLPRISPLSFALDTKDSEWYYHTYLVNSSETHFTSITLESGWFISDDEGVVQTETVKFVLNNVQPNTCVSVDRIDYLERDMNIWYHIECIDDLGAVSHYEINIPKSLSEEGLKEIPFLKKQGWILDLNVKNTPASQKKIVYIDMDNVLVDFKSGIARLPQETVEKYGDDLDDVPGIFAMMDPLPWAVDAFHRIADKYDTYILSSAPWENPLALSDKVVWVKRHLGDVAKKRLIISHHKNLNKWDYLIDDRTRNGAGEFGWEHIHFGTEKFPDWENVLTYLNV